MNLPRFGILLLASGWTSLAAPGPTPPAALPPGDRFLFVVDTSSGMANLAQACRRAVFELIWSGLDGYMQPGDTYGLWTFSEQVQKNRLPMQIWRSNSVELASVASRFLAQQPYQNSSHPETALATLKPTVQLVRDLVVILITDGRAPIAGTPFDAAIRAACKQRAAQARKLRQPLLIVLTARGGEWVRWSVHLPGEKLDLPQRVSQPTSPSQVTALTVSTNAVSQAASTNPPAAWSAGSVVLTPSPSAAPAPPTFTASLTNPVELTEPPVSPTTSNTVSQQPTPELPSTPAPPSLQPDAPASPAPQPAEPRQPPASASSDPGSLSPGQPTPNQPAPTGSNETARLPVEPDPADAALSRPSPPSPWLAPARTAAPPVVLRPKSSALVSAPAQPDSSRSGPLASTALGSRASAQASKLPSLGPESVQARELPKHPVAPVASAPAAAPLGPPTGRSAVGSVIFRPGVMLAIGLGLLLAALTLTVVFLRRVRPHSHRSIISESLDRTGRPFDGR